MIPLLLACLLSTQQPAAEAPAAQRAPLPADAWRDVDGIYMIINEDTVTQRQIATRRADYMREHPNIDRPNATQILQREMVLAAVGAQAGETMGIDPALIERSVREWERRVIESKGGVADYSKFLAEKGLTAEEMREQTRRTVLREVWEDSRTGKGPNQNQRVIADRYVRPGYIRMNYTQLARDPRLVAKIGGTSSQVVLQILEIDPAKVGGTSSAEVAATKMRARIATGETDFEAESGFIMSGTKYGPRDPIDESTLPGVDPALAKLVARAKDGEVLAPVPPQDKIPQWRVVRLVKRIPAVVPAFSTPGLQDKIRELLEGMLDELRLAEARGEQYAGSYIWPPEAAAH